MPENPVSEMVPRSELERAVAEAVAAEQRKRRRVQLALAAAVGLLLAAGGAFAWWRGETKADQAAAEAQRRAEQAAWEAEGKVKADLMRERANEMLRLAEDLRRQYRFEQAAAALQQAEQLLGGDADLAPAVQKAKADLEFIRALDEIRLRKATWIAEPGGKGRFDEGAAAPAYRKAFAARGLDIMDGSVEEMAKRVAASPIRNDLIAALDHWAVLESEVAVRDRVLAVVRAADPDAVRDRLRDPKVWADPAKLKALAAEVRAAELPPAGVVALATLLRRHGLDPAPLLREAIAQHPRDFQLMFAAGQLAVGREPGEAIRWYQASLAVRPDNAAALVNMGVALHAMGNRDGATAAFREALRLDPGNAEARAILEQPDRLAPPPREVTRP